MAKIMGLCTKSYGITLIGKPSAQAVGRAVLEGYIAAQIQLGSEVYNAEGKMSYKKAQSQLCLSVPYAGLTLSVDGTTHLNTVWESKHSSS